MDKKYICPCGLTCCDCLFYKPEIYNTAKKLRKVIKDSQWDFFISENVKNESWNVIAKHLSEKGTEIAKYFEAFKKLSEFLHVLDGIIQLQCKKTCREAKGCSMGGTTKVCNSLKCVNLKGYDGCWECKEHETCPKLDFVKRAYGETVEGNFKIINTKGIDAVKSRGNKYYAWQQQKDK